MYNPKLAAKYWDSRIKHYDLEHAVLSLNLPEYLNEAYSSWEFQTLLKQLGKIRQNKILDIACGGGRIAIPLAQRGAEVTGVDISKEMLNHAKKLAKKKLCHKHTEFINEVAWDTKLPSGVYDKVLLLGILEHLPDNFKKKAIKEAYRLTKRGGKIYLVINNKNSFFLNLVKKWKKPTQKRTGYYSSLVYPKQIIAFLKSLKLKVDEVNSNLNYSILFLLLNRIEQKSISKEDIEGIYTIFQYYINLDLKRLGSKISKQYSSLEQRFADQFFIIAKK